jgi:hypothetical protein
MSYQAVHSVTGALRHGHDETGPDSFGQLGAHCFDALYLSGAAGHFRQGKAQRIFFQQLNHPVWLGLWRAALSSTGRLGRGRASASGLISGRHSFTNCRRNLTLAMQRGVQRLIACAFFLRLTKWSWRQIALIIF